MSNFTSFKIDESLLFALLFFFFFFFFLFWCFFSLEKAEKWKEKKKKFLQQFQDLYGILLKLN